MPKLLWLAAISTVVTLIQGCAEPLTPYQQRVQREAAEERQAQAQRSERARIDNLCLTYGFTKNTPSFAKCVQGEYEKNNRRAQMDVCLNEALSTWRYCKIGAMASSKDRNGFADENTRREGRICDDRKKNTEDECYSRFK